MTHFPETLRTWRKARRFSQLELALEANVSSRHISFLETGRAQPSREMIGRLGDALDLPLATRNQMLTHAGFAIRYPTRDWNHEDMEPVRAALEHTLTNHAPYPAIAIDRLWVVLRMNRPAQKLFGMHGIKEGSSLVDLAVSDFLPTIIENWSEVAHHSALRLRTESAAQGGIPEFDRAADRLAKFQTPKVQAANPVVPTIYKSGDLRLSLFSTIAQFGTPTDLTLDDVKIELFFPADAETGEVLRQIGEAD